MDEIVEFGSIRCYTGEIQGFYWFWRGLEKSFMKGFSEVHRLSAGTVPTKLWVPHGVFRVGGYIMNYVMEGW